MKRFTDKVVSREGVDAVVVGARIDGAATAITLTRRGRKVIALDRAKWPLDTISTHVLFAIGVAELNWLGALDRVRAVGAPEWRVGYPNTVVLPRTGQRLEPRGRMTPLNGIDYGLNTRRRRADYRRFSRWGRNGWSPQTTPRRPGTTLTVGAA
jgi:menaquinone-9 beta-reductase